MPTDKSSRTKRITILTHAGFFLVGIANTMLGPVLPILADKLIGILFVLASLGGAMLPWLVGSLSTYHGALRAGLIIPLLSVGIMLALQTAIGLSGRGFTGWIR